MSVLFIDGGVFEIDQSHISMLAEIGEKGVLI